MAKELTTSPASAGADAEVMDATGAGHTDVDQTGADLIDMVAWFDQCMNQLAGARCQAIDLARRQSEQQVGAASDPGMARRAFTAEIAAALHISERAAENLIGVSKVIGESLPKTQQALNDGSISFRHAQIMVDHAAGLEPDAVAQLERLVLDKATTSSPPRFDSFVRRTRERLNPETIEQRHVAAVEQRTVVVDEARDGMAWLSALLPAPQAHAIFDRLTSAGLAMGRSRRGGRSASDGDGGTGGGLIADAAGAGGRASDSRTLAQRRADAFAAVMLAAGECSVSGSSADGRRLEGGSDSAGGRSAGGSGADDDSEITASAPDDDSAEFARWFRGITARVILTVPALSLLDRGDEPAVLDGYGPIDLHTARILAARAPSFIRVLTHPETGAVLSVGRERYKVPKDLRAWLRVRDGTCRFVGCGQRADRCDIDHTIEWQHGGYTAHDNLAHLCRRHHMLKGSGRWAVRQSGCGDGTLAWTSPTGREYVTEPEASFGAVAAVSAASAASAAS
jgi:hypothetical protein